MKKTYKSIKTFIVLLSLVAFQMGAQISGTVTINSAAATGGTNYQSFTALATALNTSGINGPLTVNVVAASGPYVEQPSFNVITGVSATNTITINGNGNTLTFGATSSAAPWTLNLNGADRMTFNNLNVVGTGATYAYVCLLSAGADYNTFSACTFSCPLNGTSTSHYPVIFSGINSGVSNTNSGNYDTFLNCTMSNGWYGIYMYGLTAVPYQTNNTIQGCTVQDFNYMGVYCYYQKNPSLIRNTVERPTRTSSYTSTTYGMYVYYTQGTVVDGNRVQKIYEGMQTTTNTTYGIYFYYNSVGSGANRNMLRNNIVCDLKSNGTIYGMYGYYFDGGIYHNTISIDHTGSTATGITYAMYTYGGSGYSEDIKNNIISVTRGGSGTKYCIYFGTTGNVTVDRNNLYMGSLAGTNNLVYYGSAYANLAAYQTGTGLDPNGFSVDPQFTALPGNVIPTNATINNQGTPVGVVTDVLNAPRSSVNPDLGAHEFLSVACAGTPSANTVVTPTYAICPNNSANLGLGAYFSDLGITYQWQSSTTSSVGPWVNAPANGNGVLYTTPSLTASTWFNCVVTCTNGGGNINAVGQVSVAGTTTNSVPYFEGFEGIGQSNRLPNCSWSSTNLGGSTLTYTSSNTLGRSPRTGTSFASFQYLPAGSNYYFTNGIYLNAGVTYSAALWYQTEYYGYNTWTDMSILLNTTQSATGASTIVSSNGPAISNVYKSLSNTFTVATSGLYYVGIQGISANICCANYLNWDDLSITIPCTVNSPSMNISVNNTVVCAGDQVSFNATGADSYQWSTGATGSSMNDNPFSSTNYNVVGTNTLSGCTVTLTQMVTVNPAPSIYVYTNSNSVCAGQSMNLTAFGANSYTWNTGAFSPNITVSPSANTTYSVTGSNANGCIGTAVQAIVVNPLPTVTVNSSAPNEMCNGEVQTLTAGGNGVTFQWIVGNTGMIMSGNPVSISPSSTTIYTVTATGANGCSNKTTITQNVGECVGLKENTLKGVKVYPNPTAGEFTVELNNTLNKTIDVTDIAGRIISSASSNQSVVKVNISNLANGIYYVKIQSNNATEVIKVVKN